MVERRLQHVEKLLTDGKTRAEIVTDCARRWGIRERTTDDYISRARKKWAVSATEDSSEVRENSIRRLERLCARLEKEQAWAPLVSAERLLADVSGVRQTAPAVEIINHAPALPDISLAEAIEHIEASQETLREARACGLLPPAKPGEIGYREDAEWTDDPDDGPGMGVDAKDDDDRTLAEVEALLG